MQHLIKRVTVGRKSIIDVPTSLEVKVGVGADIVVDGEDVVADPSPVVKV